MVSAADPIPASVSDAASARGPGRRAGVASAVLFFVFVYSLGASTSMAVPLIANRAPEKAPAIFAAYFFCVVFGQLCVYRYPALATSRGLMLLVRAVLLGAFSLMALMPSAWGLGVGRAIQGLAGGIVILQAFQEAMRRVDPAAQERSVALLSSFYAVGYATGAIVGDVLLSLAGATLGLLGFGIAVFVLSLLHTARIPSPRLAPANPAPPAEDIRASWFERFSILFIAKLFYGYVLTFLTAHRGIPGFTTPLWLLILALSVFFAGGQILGARVARSRYAPLIGACASLGMGASLFWFYRQPAPLPLGLFALLQSILYFEGVRVSGIKPKDLRSYALYNALSDPGMACGAILSGQGFLGFAGAAVLALVLFAVFFHARRIDWRP